MVASPKTRVQVDFESGLRLAQAVRRDVDRLVGWLESRAAEGGLTVESVRVSRWRSVETPQNRETVVDVRVAGPEAAALRLWEDADAFVAELPSASPEHARAPLSVGVPWR